MAATYAGRTESSSHNYTRHNYISHPKDTGFCVADAYVVMAHRVMSCIAMAHVVMACITMAYVVMAYVVYGPGGGADHDFCVSDACVLRCLVDLVRLLLTKTAC